MKTKNLIVLLVASCSFIVCIIIAELFLRFFAPIPDPYEKYYQRLNQYVKLEHKPDLRHITELEAELPGAAGQNVFSTNNMGFRGDYLTSPKPENEFRIFIMGPSNAECFYVDDSESIDSVLQMKLNNHAPDGLSVKVYNAGRTTSYSDDIISMLVHRIVHLEPDMIIVFVVDLWKPMRDPDYLHYLSDAPRKKFPLFNFLATEFQVSRRIYYLIKNLSPTDADLFETIALKSKYKEAIAKLKSYPISNIKPKTNVPAYSDNLRTIIGVAKSHKIPIVFVTSPSTWNSDIDPDAKNWHWALYYGGVRYQEELMQNALELYNDAMLQMSNEYSVSVFDLAKLMPKSSRYFYDDLHFNTEGAYFAGDNLSSFILQEELIRR